MTPPVAPGLTIKAVLVLGFGATFGLWLFAGYYFTERIAEVQRESAAVNRRYMQAQELLSRVRTQVLLGSLYVRDALLDPDPKSVVTYRSQLQATYADIDSSLREYVPILNSVAEQDRVNRLRGEIDDFRRTLLGVLDTNHAQWRVQARLLLSRIMPRRASVMQMSDEFQTLNRSAFVEQQQVVADIYSETQRRIWQTLALALAASFGIGLFATVYVGRLERDLRRQRATQLQVTDDLQRLSTELVRVQEEERRTIARELHDEVGQVLMAIKVELAVAQRRLATSGGPERMLDDAQAITDGALNTVRDLSHLLHPAMLDDLGLVAVLEWYLAGFGKRHGIPVELLQDGMTGRLAPEIEAAAYRVVQEALTNIAKHAKATLAFVYLRCSAATFEVTIEDNGIGFDPARPRRGLGLIGIRERVANLGGRVHVNSAPGEGTRLTIEVPVRMRVGTPEPDVSDAPETTSKREVLLG